MIKQSGGGLSDVCRNQYLYYWSPCKVCNAILFGSCFSQQHFATFPAQQGLRQVVHYDYDLSV